MGEGGARGEGVSLLSRTRGCGVLDGVGGREDIPDRQDTAGEGVVASMNEYTGSKYPLPPTPAPPSLTPGTMQRVCPCLMTPGPSSAQARCATKPGWWWWVGGRG